MIATIPCVATGGTAVVPRVECGDSSCDGAQVREEFEAIVAANFRRHPTTVGRLRRIPPHRPARLVTAVLPRRPTGTDRRATPRRAGIAARRSRPRQRSPPRGRPAPGT
ncbi:hypothetical protein ACQEVB_14420 [Pseudonocardia sp. CA-107938]|uniref:hypothetical protein n=1 Tax=Pseudonocardia sp. CA-107938 TaxID=3240021 RepID=UPI003D90334C